MKLLLTSYFSLLIFLLPSLVQAADVNGFDLGSVEIQVLGSSSEISMGQTGEVGKFRVSNRSGRNLILDSLRLRNYGSADLTKSFESIYLTTTTGEVLAELASSSRKYWTFKFLDQMELGRGDSLILSVKARLIYAKRGQTVQFGMRRDEDLAIKDRSSSFGVRCTNCEGTRLKEYRLDTGGIYIARQPTYRPTARYYGSRNRVYSGTAYESQFKNVRVLRTNTYRPTSSRYISTPRTSQQYSPGSKDVIFFSSRLNSRSAVGVDGLFLNVGSGLNVADKDGDGQTTADDIDETFGNWRLLINGISEDTSFSLDEYNGQLGVLFNSSMEIPANAQIVMIGRVKNAAQTGDKIRFGLSRSGLLSPEYLFNGNSVNTINGGSTSNYSSVR